MTKGVPPQAGSGHSPKGGAASSTASPAQPSVPNAAWLHRNLTRPEISAFLAFFASAWTTLRCFTHGETGKEMPVTFGKAECEWVPFRETWQDKFPALGLTTFQESGPRPALGMVPGSTWTEIHIDVTDFGRALREAFWSSVNASGMEAREGRDAAERLDGEAATARPDAQPLEPKD